MLDPVVDRQFRVAAAEERRVGLRCLSAYWAGRTGPLYRARDAASPPLWGDFPAVCQSAAWGASESLLASLTPSATCTPAVGGGEADLLTTPPSPSGLLQELLRKKRGAATPLGLPPAPPAARPPEQGRGPPAQARINPIWLADVDWDAPPTGPGPEHSTSLVVREVVAMFLSAGCPTFRSAPSPPSEALFHLDPAGPRYAVHPPALRRHAAAAAVPPAALQGLLGRFAALATRVAAVAEFCHAALGSGAYNAAGADADGDTPMPTHHGGPDPHKACLTVTFAHVALGFLQQFQRCAVHLSIQSRMNRPSSPPKDVAGSPASAKEGGFPGPLTLAWLHCTMALEQWPSLEVLAQIVLALQQEPHTVGVSAGVRLLNVLQRLCRAWQARGAAAQFAIAHHVLVACLTPYLAMVDYWQGATPRAGNPYRGVDWSLIQSRTQEWAISDDQYWPQCYALTSQQNIPTLLQPLARQVLTTAKAAHLLECIRIHGDPPPPAPVRPALAQRPASVRSSRSRRGPAHASKSRPTGRLPPLPLDCVPPVADHFARRFARPPPPSPTRPTAWGPRPTAAYAVDAGQWLPLRPGGTWLAQPPQPSEAPGGTAADEWRLDTEVDMEVDVPTHNPIFDEVTAPYGALDFTFDAPGDLDGSSLGDLLSGARRAPRSSGGPAGDPRPPPDPAPPPAPGGADVPEAPTSSGPPCTDALLQLHSADRHRPLALALEAPLREAVHRWHTALNPRLLRLIVHDYRLPEYFEALHRYWLLGQGDVMRTYMEAIFDRIAAKQEWWSPAGLQALWQACVPDSGALVEERTALQPFADAPADPTARSHTQSIVCLAGLGFHFVLDFPINLVLAAADIGQYNAIFGFLVQLHYVKHSLERIALPPAMAGNRRKEASPHHPLSHAIFLLRSRMLHATNALVQYFFHRLASGWRALMAGLAAARDVDGLRALHAAQLRAMVAGCLLAPQAGPVKAAVDRLLDACLELRRKCEAYVERASLLPPGMGLPAEEREGVARALGKVQQRFDNAHAFLLAVLEKVRRTERDPTSCVDELYTRLNFNRFYDQRAISPLW